MSREVAVHVEGVSKKFCRQLRQSVVYAAADSARELLSLPIPRQRLRSGEFWAVRDAEFELYRGECLGLIGANGAGKSTVLKMLNGILRPDTGRIRLRGRVGALIEVGAGFHPMLTGRENVYVNGAILGMSQRELEKKFDSIVGFSGLSQEALDAPVKTYSSGMHVRLGFAVAAHSDPQILLVDEVLSVGDLEFVGRCRRYISQLLAGGAAIIFVTHRLHEVELMCERAMLMRDGEIVMQGPARSVVDTYRAGDEGADGARPLNATWGVEGGTAPHIKRLRVLDASGAEPETFEVGSWALLEIELERLGPDFEGELFFGLSCVDRRLVTAAAAVPWGTVARLAPQGTLRCRIRLMAIPDEYQLYVRVHGDREFDYLDQATSRSFQIVPGGKGAPYLPGGTRAEALLELHVDGE